MLRLFNNVEKSEPSRLPEPPTKTASNYQQRFACCGKGGSECIQSGSPECRAAAQG